MSNLELSLLRKGNCKQAVVSLMLLPRCLLIENDLLSLPIISTQIRKGERSILTHSDSSVFTDNVLFMQGKSSSFSSKNISSSHPTGSILQMKFTSVYRGPALKTMHPLISA